MAKMKTQQIVDNSAEQIIKSIDERIDLLTIIRAAITVAFGVAPDEFSPVSEEGKLPVGTKARARRSISRARKGGAKRGTRGRPGTTMALVLSVLGERTLSTGEIMERMTSRGWSTAGKTSPRGLVGTTLRNMEKAGKIRRVGEDWEVAPSSGPVMTATVDAASEQIATN